MIGFTLEPLDTLFFRDSTPFASSSSSQDDVGGLFPPFPFTVVGAIRAALARNRGWDGISPWSDELKSVLGAGSCSLGRLSFTGPFVVNQDEVLYPMPRHVLGERINGSWVPKGFLGPGQPARCDLGDAVRLPDLVAANEDERVLKPPDELWIRTEGLSAILNGRLPDGGGREQSLKRPWNQEVRIGLERDNVSRTAIEGQLYTTRHVRPNRDIRLGVLVDGIPDDWCPLDSQIVPLGGEGRVASLNRWSIRPSLDAPIERIRSTGKLALIALTPLDIHREAISGHRPVDGLDCEAIVTSACIDRQIRIGGWDSTNRRPMPLRSLVPAGSVLFCEVRNSNGLSHDLHDAKETGYLRVGNGCEYGFGLVAPATWPE